MRLNVFSLYDREKKVFGSLISMQSTVDLFRYVETWDMPIIKKHPEQFCIRQVGYYDIETGALTPCASLDTVLEFKDLYRIVEKTVSAEELATAYANEHLALRAKRELDNKEE